MLEAEVEALLAPLSADDPCGADLEYDPAFMALIELAAGRPEQQYGDTVIEAQPPDWAAVHAKALDMAGRTRDLRVAVLLTRSGARTKGLPGAVRGLQLVQGLVTRYWEQVHPQLDATDNDDPTARMSALSPLVHPDAGLSDLRGASLTGKRGSLTVRDIEIAIGHVEALPGEAVPTEDGVLQGVSAALAEVPVLAALMVSGFEATQTLGSDVEQRVEASQSPDFAPLKKLMQRVAESARKAQGGDVAGPAPGEPGALVTRPAGSIASREDAIRALDRVCEWIELNEPSNPAPLLIRRSQRLMNKDFLDIIRDLVPDGLRDVEKLAGISDS